MAATRLWNGTFPLEPVADRAICQDCLTAQQARADAKRVIERERAAAASQRKVESASAWLRASLNASEPDASPTSYQAVGLLALAEILLHGELASFGPLKSLSYTITSFTSSDIELFREMFQARWIAATTPATVECFTYDEDDQAITMYIDAVCWTFPRWFGLTSREAAVTAAKVLRNQLADQIDAIIEIVQQLEANMAVGYLDGLLTGHYGELPIPEHRLPDAYEYALKALRNGYALEQVVSMAWSAAAASVAWGQRTAGLKPGAVSSASVTNLGRHIRFTNNRPVPHCDILNSVPRPAMYGTAIRFLSERQEAHASLANFRAVYRTEKF
ncbi:hypothetical protein [Streptomyces sp. NPDC088752]|uniref:hypothetical protein n=1 Tax=Streptomyces sp. NPDC088752 TaxID=3154963 RepID=UPI0034311DCC